jgi:hypothetical protein
MKETLFMTGYGIAVVVLAVLEGFLLRALGLGGKWTGLLYAIPTNLVCCVIAPVGVLASVAAGFLGVFSQINNANHVSAKEAFGSWAGPLAVLALGFIGVVRILPLLLMNFRSPFKALLYAVLSTAVLAVLFTVSGFALLAAMDERKAS